MKRKTEDRSSHFLYPVCNRCCEKWRGTQKRKGKGLQALLGGSIPSRASIDSASCNLRPTFMMPS
jgi:hypothetical protein